MVALVIAGGLPASPDSERLLDLRCGQVVGVPGLVRVDSAGPGGYQADD